jgi:hypothetical protein
VYFCKWHNVPPSSTTIKKIKKENLYSNKLENLKGMGKFLDTYKHLKLKQDDMTHLNRSITSNEIKVAIKSFPKKKVLDLMN